MTLCRHIRRRDPVPHAGQWVLRCDCGWEGRTAQLDGIRHLGRPEVEEALEEAFLAHLSDEERQTYLLVDARPAPIRDQDHDGVIGIVGVFVMPEAVPVRFMAERIEDEVHYGSFILDGEQRELPIGEVRTPEGRVFRLDQ